MKKKKPLKGRVVDPTLIKYIKDKNDRQNRGGKNSMANILDLTSKKLEDASIPKLDILQGYATAQDSLVKYLQEEANQEEEAKTRQEEAAKLKRTKLKKYMSLDNSQDRAKFMAKHKISPIDVIAFTKNKRAEKNKQTLEDYKDLKDNYMDETSSHTQIFGEDDLFNPDKDEVGKVQHSFVKGGGKDVAERQRGNKSFLAETLGVTLPKDENGEVDDYVEEEDDYLHDMFDDSGNPV